MARTLRTGHAWDTSGTDLLIHDPNHPGDVEAVGEVTTRGSAFYAGISYYGRGLTSLGTHARYPEHVSPDDYSAGPFRTQHRAQIAAEALYGRARYGRNPRTGRR